MGQSMGGDLVEPRRDWLLKMLHHREREEHEGGMVQSALVYLARFALKASFDASHCLRPPGNKVAHCEADRTGEPRVEDADK